MSDSDNFPPRFQQIPGRSGKITTVRMLPATDTAWEGTVQSVGRLTLRATQMIGDMTMFAVRVVTTSAIRWPRRGVLLTTCHQVGVETVPVVIITGLFIGMVLAVQAYNQFHQNHLDSRLGALISSTLLNELGPVLAGAMLAGRVGSAMAAELGTMRITEQFDALEVLGAQPVRHLAVPRFLACCLLIPLLTIVTDAMGVLGGWLIATKMFGVQNHTFWQHAERVVGYWDLLTGALKSLFFGGAIAVIACHRGFRCSAGAEGVGQAATQAFVVSFAVILALDFCLGSILNVIYFHLWPVS
jgi:phospholipid/cholesterol/gamma-HCH transport system permease protein